MKETKHLLTDKQRIEFVKQLQDIYEVNHPSWKRILTFSFIKGLATGFGVFIGGTIVVGLLLWILSGLSNIPFLNDVTDTAQRTLQQNK